jgi:TonB family protein
MNLRLFFIAACFALLLSKSFAQDLPAQDTYEQEVKKRADALLEHARQLSDIRSLNAPAFTLKATFSFVGKDLETVHGNYTEVWVSHSQWRREIAVKDERRIEVAGTSRIWRLDKNPNFPEGATQLHSLINMFPLGSSSLDFESVVRHSETNPPVECAITKPDSARHKSGFCFDQKSGALIQRIFPEVRPSNTVENSCDYGSFHKIGGFWVPREITCSQDRHRKLDIQIIDFSRASSFDPTLFTPPSNAIELGDCPVSAVAPRPTSSPFRILIRVDPENVSWATVWFVVDTNGRTQYARVLGSSPGKEKSDKDTLNRIRDWKFKPGTCNGEPMPMPITTRLPAW